MRELFIYYRIHLDHLNAARAAVVSMQAELMAAHAHLQARVLFRPDAQGGFQTWMETYATDAAHAPEGITAELESEIERRSAGLAPYLHGTRHVEAFVPCAS